MPFCTTNKTLNTQLYRLAIKFSHFSQKISSSKKIRHINGNKRKPGGKNYDTRKFCINHKHSKLDVHPVQRRYVSVMQRKNRLPHAGICKKL